MADTPAVTTEATALEGTTTVDATHSIEAEILSYRMLRRAATKITSEVVKKIPKNRAILIHSDADMIALTAFRTFASQMSQLQKSYAELAPGAGPEEVVATIAAMTVGLKAFIDFIALFRTNRQIVGVPITIEDLALVSEVGGALAAEKRKVYVTQLYPRAGDAATIELALDATRKEAQAAKTRVSTIADPAEKTAAEARLQQLDDIRKGYDDLFTKVADATAVLGTLVRGAGIAALLESEAGANILYLKMLKAAGTNETKRNLLGLKSELTHSGGVVVNFMLFDKDGSILFARTVTAYSGEIREVSTDE